MILETVLTIINYLIISVIATSCGYAILSYLGFKIESRNIRIITSFALGYMIASYGAYILGYTKILNTQSLTLLLLFMFVISLPRFKKFVNDLNEVEFFTKRPKGFFDDVDTSLRTIIVLLIFALLAILVAASIVPPSGWDTLNYHLAIPKIFLQFEEIRHLPTIFHSHFPLPVQFQYLVLMGLTSASAASMLTLTYLVLTLVIMREMLKMMNYEHLWHTTIAVLFSITVVLFSTHETLIEPSAMFYITLAVFFCIQLIQKHSIGTVILIGIISGYAAATKYSNLPFIVLIPLSLGITMLGRNHVRPRVLMFISVVGIVVALPWYLRTWIDTGNPFWPYFLTFIPSLYNENVYTLSKNTPGIAKIIEVEKNRLSFILETIWKVLSKPIRMIFFPDQFGGDDPKAGPLLLGLIPFVFMKLKDWNNRKRYLMLMIYTSLLFFVVWLVTFHNTRYLAPIFPITAIVLGLAYEKATESPAVRRIVQLIIIGSLGLSLLITGKANLTKINTYVSSANEIEYYNNLQSPYGGQMVREFGASHYINSIATEDTKVLILGGLFGYFLDVEWEIGRYDAQVKYDYSTINSIQDMSDMLKEHNITHILAPFSQTEERQPRYENILEFFEDMNMKEEQTKNGFDVLMFEFIPNHAKQLYEQHGVYVYQVNYIETGLVLDGLRIVKHNRDV